MNATAEEKASLARTALISGLVFALVLAVAGSIYVFAASEKVAKGEDPARKLHPVVETLRPLHKKMPKPKPGDWLARHDEKGQTFKEYLAYDPVHPTEERKTIYILPIGKFTAKQKAIIDLTAEFSKIFYRLPVVTMKGIDDSEIPKQARRVHPQWGDKQFLSTYILDKVLAKRLPKDGVVILGLTATDLWPGRNWNFVFGQASISERVGVWSIYRNGNADGNKKEFDLCLLRTLKTAVHETGHMFSMLHCTAYECGMCGSNSRPESDARPLGFCPECMAKVCWLTDANPVKRFEILADFCKKHRLKEDAALYDAQIKLLKKGALK